MLRSSDVRGVATVSEVSEWSSHTCDECRHGADLHPRSTRSPDGCGAYEVGEDGRPVWCDCRLPRGQIRNAAGRTRPQYYTHSPEKFRYFTCQDCGHPALAHPYSRNGSGCSHGCGCRASRFDVRRTYVDPAPRPAIPAFIRRAVVERDGHVCYLCGRRVYTDGRAKRWPRRRLTLDHVVPYSRGGSDSYENLRVCCLSCNSIKGASA